MPFITSDQIRDMSIKTVESFLNSKVPLSEGLAKHASFYQLNSDQVQRAVEATNSIAYLKVLSFSDDRTVEFPLCKYAEVMQTLAVPESLVKAAHIKTVIEAEPMEKIASATVEESKPELSDGEKHTYFIKLAAQNRMELGQLKDREMELGPELIKAAKDLSADPYGLQKISHVVSGKEFAQVTTLVYGVPKEPIEDWMFKSAELVEVNNLVGLLKEAHQVLADIKVKEDLETRSEMVKEAFFGAIGAGIGRLAGATVSAPMKMVGKTIGRTASNIAGKFKQSGAEAANKVREAVGAAPKPVPVFTPKRMGIGAIGVAGATVAGDAVMYSPGRDKTTGRSKDVWTSLQREPNN